MDFFHWCLKLLLVHSCNDLGLLKHPALCDKSIFARSGNGLVRRSCSVCACPVPGQVTKRSSTGLLAAAFTAIVPSYISRSVGGSYDNEGVAIFALIFVFYLWIKSVNTGSMMWACLTVSALTPCTHPQGQRATYHCSAS